MTGNLTPSSGLFSSPAETKSKEKDDKNKQSDKPSPFANFTFGQGNPNKSFTELFGNISTGKAESPQTSITSKAQSTPVESSHNKSHHEEDVDHYEPTAQFEPVIALPDLVEVKTGEEDEDVMFVHRAKVLRFDPTAKEWKDRGVGDMKVLVHKTDPNKARLVMRREQIFKLCCNMVITKELTFKKMTTTTYSFGGQDFSENEMRTETLAIRFKTPELLEQFLTAVKGVQQKLGTSKAPEKKVEKKEEKKGFGDLFKPKVGSWTCEGCYISNKAETLYCVACDSPKDSTVPKKEAKSLLEPAADAPKFSFGMPTAGGFSFGMPPAAVDAATPAPAPVAQVTVPPVQSGGFTFGVQPAATAPAVAPATGFSFGKTSEQPKEAAADSTTGAKSFSFGMPAAVKAPEIVAPVTPSTDAPKFNFVFKKKSPAKSPAKNRNDSVNSEGAEEEDEYNEEENQTYFTPAIPLPEKVDVVTGEENETVLYSHRAKLYRFTDKEWKERGLGDIKILRHNETKKLR